MPAIRARLLAALLLPLALAACESDAPETAAPPVAETEPEPEAPPPPFYVGTWAFDPDWCAAAPPEGTPVTIEENRLLGYENVCEMTSVAQTPEGGWLATLSCVAEGMASEERLVMTPVDTGLSLAYPDREGAEPALFHRCPE